MYNQNDILYQSLAKKNIAGADYGLSKQPEYFKRQEESYLKKSKGNYCSQC